MLTLLSKKHFCRKLVGCLTVVALVIGIMCFSGCCNSKKESANNELTSLLNNFNSTHSEEYINSLYDKLNESNVSFMSYTNGNEKRTTLYDFSNRPVYELIDYNTPDGYSICNMLTGNYIEKTESGYSPYHNKECYKLYYAGYMNYFYEINGEIYSIVDNKNISSTEINFYNDFSNFLAISEYEENNNKEISVVPMTSNSDRNNNSKIMDGGIYFENLDPAYGRYYYADGICDLKFPENDGSSCGVVSTVQLLQFYERNNKHVIPNAFYEAHSFSTTNTYNKINRSSNTSYFSQVLHDEIDSLTWGGAFGENYTQNLTKGLNKFYEKYGKQSNETLYRIIPNYNAFYNNMVGSVDSGKPAVGMTSTGNGYYKVNGAWKSKGCAGHHMIVYGYCTTNRGTLKDFICHSGWSIAGTQKMYVYKLNFVSNYTHELELQ